MYVCNEVCSVRGEDLALLGKISLRSSGMNQRIYIVQMSELTVSNPTSLTWARWEVSNDGKRVITGASAMTVNTRFKKLSVFCANQYIYQHTLYVSLRLDSCVLSWIMRFSCSWTRQDRQNLSHVNNLIT